MKIPEREKPQKKVINKGFLRDLEGYEQSDKNLFHLPRQHLTKWSKTQYLCGVQATGAGLLSTFYQH